MKKTPETGNTPFWDFVELKKMITPTLLVFVFWIGVVGCIFAGLWQLLEAQNPWDLKKASLGVAVLILGPLFLRIGCEFLILFFRMNETLTEIRNERKGSASEKVKVNS